MGVGFCFLGNDINKLYVFIGGRNGKAKFNKFKSGFIVGGGLQSSTE